MFTFKFTIVAFLLASRALGVPVEKRQACTEILQRKAWNTLTDVEKTEYLNAELCLMWQRPAQSGLEATVSRFDDLQKLHQLQTDWIHGDGWFLPFHRLYVHAHEKLLRDECNYTGAQPYWDEVSDAGNFNQSVVFDPVVGFGGNGVGGTDSQAGCIADGPFANYTLHIGPETNNTDHCLSRAIDDTQSKTANQSSVDTCLAMSTFAEAWPCIQADPHTAGHWGVAGEMYDLYSSPGDPLFYLHHAFIDRLWWLWQEMDLDNRLTEIAGYTTTVEPAGGWVNATLNDTLDMYGIIPNATIADVMDIGGSLLCYEYISP